jgi:4'-phosphopantetheinyl transferase
LRVFLATLDGLPPLGPELTGLMAPSRREKALAFAKAPDRGRSILAGLLLREVLGVTEDQDLWLEPAGKPRLAGSPLNFSLSHSGPYVALSVGFPPHGLDAQERRTRPIPAGLARWALSPAEIAALSENPDPDTFVRAWTMKEAYAKATGRGLSAGLNAFSVLPLESGPRPVEGREVFFHLMALPGAAMSLASLTPSLPPLVMNLNARISRLIAHGRGETGPAPIYKVRR